MASKLQPFVYKLGNAGKQKIKFHQEQANNYYFSGLRETEE